MNTLPTSAYLQYCQEQGLKAHPARYPAAPPEYFIRMLTDEGDWVFDPFGGSCVTEEVAEQLGRHWTCCELHEEFLQGALGRFAPDSATQPDVRRPDGTSSYYRMPHPGLLWNGADGPMLPADGGKQRILVQRDAHVNLSPKHPDESETVEDDPLQMKLLDSPQSYDVDDD